MKNAFVKLFKNVPCILIYSFFGLLVLGMNMMLIPALFHSAGDSYIGTDGGYVIMMCIYGIGIFLTVFFLAPYQSKIQIDGSDRLKRFVIGLPIFVVTILQSSIYSLCALFSRYFDLFPLTVFFHGVLICVLTYLLILACEKLYKLSGSMLFGWLGVINFIISPIFLTYFLESLYSLNSAAPAFQESFVRIALLFVLILAHVTAMLVKEAKRAKDENADFFSVMAAQKMITAFPMSLTIAYLLMLQFGSKVTLSLSYILTFSAIAIAVLTVFVLIIFIKHKPFVKIIISDILAVVTIALIFALVPMIANKKTNELPKASQISEVDIFVDNDEYFTVKAHTKDILEAHEYLLGLFKQGYTENDHSSYDDPTCIADLWEDFDVTYTLKGGRIFSREYRRLNDPAFDEFYIKLIQSDMYSYSLCKTEIYKPVLSYEFKTGELNAFGKSRILVKKCEPPEAIIQELLETYCEELKNAERSAFYEGFDTVVLENVYAYKDFKSESRNIYLPLSFTKTREKINSIITEYPKKD